MALNNISSKVKVKIFKIKFLLQKNRSRAPSFQAGDSPVQVRSRSSTYESSFRFDNTPDANKDVLLDPNNQPRHGAGLSPNISYKKHQDLNGTTLNYQYFLHFIVLIFISTLLQSLQSQNHLDLERSR